LCVLFVLAAANYACAQDPSGVPKAWAPAPQINRFRLIPGFGPQTGVPATTPQGNGLTFTILPPQNLVARGPSRVCSVPLLEAQIPKDVQFTIRQVAPRMDELAPMPQVKVPAPECDSSASQ
jgi:hypothetical protein